VDALYAWKPGQSTLQQVGVKACGYIQAPKKANLLALRTTLGAQFGTKLALTTLPDPDTSNRSLQCYMFETDPKHRGAMLRTDLAPDWIKSEHVEMDGLWRLGALEKVLRSSLDASARIFGSRFHYKIKRQLDMSLDKLKVRLVLQGQHMKQGVDCEHSYFPVPHASRFRTMLALATVENMLINHVNISQAFLQGDLLEEKGFEGNVFISPPPSAKYVYHLCAPLYGACTSSRAWHQTCQLLWNSKASRQLASKNLRGAVTMQTETRSWWAVTLTICAYAA